MKFTVKAIIVLVLGLCLFSCSSSTDPNNLDADPKGMYLIDVKTTWTNKYTATGVKNGHIGYMRLRGAKWCVDKEFGEDHSFWIRDVRTISIGSDSIQIRFDLELRTPSLITDGDLIERRTGYVITYPTNPDFSNSGTVDAQIVADMVKTTLERNVKLTQNVSTFASSVTKVQQIKELVNFVLQEFASDSKIKQSQVEGALIGVVTFAEMRDMIKVNLEK